MAAGDVERKSMTKHSQRLRLLRRQCVCNLGVADWHGREAIRQNLRDFIDKGFTAIHDVVEYLDSPCSRSFTK